HPAVGGRAVEVEPVLLGVLAVVALVAGEAEDPLLEDRVASIPEHKRQAERLPLVADAGQPVLAPAVGARAGVVVREVLPGGAASAVVLAHGAPGPLADVRAPPAPAVADLLEASALRVAHRPSQVACTAAAVTSARGGHCYIWRHR